MFHGPDNKSEYLQVMTSPLAPHSHLFQRPSLKTEYVTSQRPRYPYGQGQGVGASGMYSPPPASLRRYEIDSYYNQGLSNPDPSLRSHSVPSRAPKPHLAPISTEESLIEELNALDERRKALSNQMEVIQRRKQVYQHHHHLSGLQPPHMRGISPNRFSATNIPPTFYETLAEQYANPSEHPPNEVPTLHSLPSMTSPQYMPPIPSTAVPLGSVHPIFKEGTLLRPYLAESYPTSAFPAATNSASRALSPTPTSALLTTAQSGTAPSVGASEAYNSPSARAREDLHIARRSLEHLSDHIKHLDTHWSGASPSSPSGKAPLASRSNDSNVDVPEVDPQILEKHPPLPPPPFLSNRSPAAKSYSAAESSSDRGASRSESRSGVSFDTNNTSPGSLGARGQLQGSGIIAAVDANFSETLQLVIQNAKSATASIDSLLRPSHTSSQDSPAVPDKASVPTGLEGVSNLPPPPPPPPRSSSNKPRSKSTPPKKPIGTPIVTTSTWTPQTPPTTVPATVPTPGTLRSPLMRSPGATYSPTSSETDTPTSVAPSTASSPASLPSFVELPSPPQWAHSSASPAMSEDGGSESGDSPLSFKPTALALGSPESPSSPNSPSIGPLFRSPSTITGGTASTRATTSASTTTTTTTTATVTATHPPPRPAQTRSASFIPFPNTQQNVTELLTTISPGNTTRSNVTPVAIRGTGAATHLGEIAPALGSARGSTGTSRSLSPTRVLSRPYLTRQGPPSHPYYTEPMPLPAQTEAASVSASLAASLSSRSASTPTTRTSPEYAVRSAVRRSPTPLSPPVPFPNRANESATSNTYGNTKEGGKSPLPLAVKLLSSLRSVHEKARSAVSAPYTQAYARRDSISSTGTHATFSPTAMQLSFTSTVSNGNTYGQSNDQPHAPSQAPMHTPQSTHHGPREVLSVGGGAAFPASQIMHTPASLSSLGHSQPYHTNNTNAHPSAPNDGEAAFPFPAQHTHPASISQYGTIVSLPMHPPTPYHDASGSVTYPYYPASIEEQITNIPHSPMHYPHHNLHSGGYPSFSQPPSAAHHSGFHASPIHPASTAPTSTIPPSDEEGSFLLHSTAYQRYQKEKSARARALAYYLRNSQSQTVGLPGYIPSSASAEYAAVTATHAASAAAAFPSLRPEAGAWPEAAPLASQRKPIQMQAPKTKTPTRRAPVPPPAATATATTVATAAANATNNADNAPHTEVSSSPVGAKHFVSSPLATSATALRPVSSPAAATAVAASPPVPTARSVFSPLQAPANTGAPQTPQVPSTQPHIPLFQPSTPETSWNEDSDSDFPPMASVLPPPTITSSRIVYAHLSPAILPRTPPASSPKAQTMPPTASSTTGFTAAPVPPAQVSKNEPGELKMRASSRMLEKQLLKQDKKAPSFDFSKAPAFDFSALPTPSSSLLSSAAPTPITSTTLLTTHTTTPAIAPVAALSVSYSPAPTTTPYISHTIDATSRKEHRPSIPSVTPMYLEIAPPANSSTPGTIKSRSFFSDPPAGTGLAVLTTHNRAQQEFNSAPTSTTTSEPSAIDASSANSFASLALATPRNDMGAIAAPSSPLSIRAQSPRVRALTEQMMQSRERVQSMLYTYSSLRAEDDANFENKEEIAARIDEATGQGLKCKLDASSRNLLGSVIGSPTQKKKLVEPEEIEAEEAVWEMDQGVSLDFASTVGDNFFSNLYNDKQRDVPELQPSEDGTFAIPPSFDRSDFAEIRSHLIRGNDLDTSKFYF